MFIFQYSWTALLVATVGGHSEVVTLLLKAKANINAKDKDGCTALAVASKEGFEDIVIALLNEGAYINIQASNLLLCTTILQFYYL
jgi:ankyrin repeat protein